MWNKISIIHTIGCNCSHGIELYSNNVYLLRYGIVAQMSTDNNNNENKKKKKKKNFFDALINNLNNLIQGTRIEDNNVCASI